MHHYLYTRVTDIDHKYRRAVGNLLKTRVLNIVTNTHRSSTLRVFQVTDYTACAKDTFQLSALSTQELYPPRLDGRAHRFTRDQSQQKYHLTIAEDAAFVCIRSSHISSRLIFKELRLRLLYATDYSRRWSGIYIFYGTGNRRPTSVCHIGTGYVALHHFSFLWPDRPNGPGLPIFSLRTTIGVGRSEFWDRFSRASRLEWRGELLKQLRERC